jgi:DNA-binding LytR/AlgR family response regulator
MQVHRSWWVGHSAIATLDSPSAPKQIVLKNGLTVPVSRSYRIKVVEACNMVTGERANLV